VALSPRTVCGTLSSKISMAVLALHMDLGETSAHVEAGWRPISLLIGLIPKFRRRFISV
jgi:hypothetical protein